MGKRCFLKIAFSSAKNQKMMITYLFAHLLFLRLESFKISFHTTSIPPMCDETMCTTYCNTLGPSLHSCPSDSGYVGFEANTVYCVISGHCLEKSGYNGGLCAIDTPECRSGGSTSSATGDPMGSNIQGDYFDLRAAGAFNFLRLTDKSFLTDSFRVD